ncbi:galactitol-1-phosphate 5-dehydrogenase [Mesorhizobium sp. IMUNJ 23232]|uniref:galactitol-1-phosphate 5-dehydrogenase n=1 Tax=Mesorhizobium sp. IMUNJ 23232 TaxID=3376064 RepID=UPI0037BE0AFF
MSATISDFMQAAVLHAPGDLRVEQVPLPKNLGDDEVLVRVMAAGICGSDIARVMVTGTYRFPTIPGHEFSGIAEEIGRGVTSVKKGDRVAVAPLMPCFECDSCRRGNYSLCDTYNFLGSRTDGGFAEFVKAPASNVMRFPDNIGFMEAATIEPAGIILHGIHKIDLKAGDSVAVIGVGALGYFGVRFAKLSGAKPLIAIDIDDAKLELAKQAGADVCINPGREDAVARIFEETGGRGVDLALETAGNNAGRELSIAAVKKQGMVLVYGSAHHDVVFKPELFEKILRREIHVLGSWNSYSVPFPGKEWFDIVNFIAAGDLSSTPLITHVLPLSEAPETFRKLADRSFGPYGKILFAPNGVDALKQ